MQQNEFSPTHQYHFLSRNLSSGTSPLPLVIIMLVDSSEMKITCNFCSLLLLCVRGGKGIYSVVYEYCEGI